MDPRMEKRVYNCVGAGPDDWSATPSLVRRFVWSGWLLLMELDANNQVLRKYCWGLDLAGQSGAASVGGPLEAGYAVAASAVSDVWGGSSFLEAAGGIGGLLAVQDTNGTAANPADDLNYVYFYDANGNVGQLVDIGAPGGWYDTRMVARYEYDPYGEVTGPDTDGDGDFDQSDNPGPYAAVNRMRFSTKYFDAESGLGYWGYRYYLPRLGRWLSRDPLEEHGDLNVYRYAGNNGSCVLDLLGLHVATSQPRLDRELVCCKLVHWHRQWGPDVGRGHTARWTEWITTPCTCVPPTNPEACCMCEHDRVASGFGWCVKVLTRDARRGPCCYCTIKVTRDPFTSRGKYAHHWVVVECPSETYAVSLWPDSRRDPLEPHAGHITDVNIDPGAPVVVESFRTSCEQGARVLRLLRTVYGRRLHQHHHHYPWEQGRSFALKIYGYLKALYREPFYDDE